MFNYIKMKRNEFKVKALFYEIIAGITDNKKEIVSLLQRIYTALKDVPADELQNELISQLAKLIHNESKGDNQEKHS